MSTPPPPRAPSRWLSLLPGAALILCVGLFVEMRLSVTRLQDAVERHTDVVVDLEAAVQLLRIEQSSEGQGIGALIEKIETFIPHLERATAYTWEYEERMEEILSAVKALGPDAFSRLLATYRNSEAGTSDELRMWLMRAAVRADPERAEEFLVKVLRGLDPNYASLQITPRNRFNAASDLLELNPERAGEVLAEILSYESVHGVNPARIPPHLKGQVPGVGMTGPGFENLLGWFLRTDHPDTPAILIRILKGSEHNLLTRQEAVKALGDLGSRSPTAASNRAAAAAIEELYLDDREAQGNPLFLNHCLDALGKILRSEACDFFREQQSVVTNELVLNKLNALLVEYC